MVIQAILLSIYHGEKLALVRYTSVCCSSRCGYCSKLESLIAQEEVLVPSTLLTKGPLFILKLEMVGIISI